MLLAVSKHHPHAEAQSQGDTRYTFRSPVAKRWPPPKLQLSRDMSGVEPAGADRFSPGNRGGNFTERPLSDEKMIHWATRGVLNWGALGQLATITPMDEWNVVPSEKAVASLARACS